MPRPLRGQRRRPRAGAGRSPPGRPADGDRRPHRPGAIRRAVLTVRMGGYRIPAALAGRLPFYYGWVILACVCCAGFSRQGPAVATRSVLVEPLTDGVGGFRTARLGVGWLRVGPGALASPV